MKFKDAVKKVMKFIDGMSEEELEKLDKKTSDEEELPVKLKEIKDTYAKWMKDAEEGKLDVAKLPIELVDVPIKTTKEADLITGDGEEETEEEKEKKKAAADKKIKDKKTKDLDEVAEEVEGLKTQVGTLINTVNALVESDKEVHASMDKKIKDEEAEAKEKEEAEEKKATEDCAANWNDITSKVEILNPGMKIVKPTKDYAKSLREIKVNALKGALTTDSKDSISVIVKEPEKLTKDALDVAFASAAEFVALKNNNRIQLSSIQVQDFKSATHARDINAKNKEFYQKQK